MNNRIVLTTTSLLSILFFTCHWVDEIARGLESGTFSAAGGIAILVIWLYGALGLSDRTAGLIIMLAGAMLGTAVPLVHMQGAGMVGRHIVDTSGVFFWVFNLVALGVTAAFSLIAAVRELWRSRRAPTALAAPAS
jgi:hypothetical protein